MIAFVLGLLIIFTILFLYSAIKIAKESEENYERKKRKNKKNK